MPYRFDDVMERNTGIVKTMLSFSCIKTLVCRVLPYALAVLILLCIGLSTQKRTPLSELSKTVLDGIRYVEYETNVTSSTDSLRNHNNGVSYEYVTNNGSSRVALVASNNTNTNKKTSRRTSRKQSLCSQYASEVKLDHVIYTNVFVNKNTAHDKICLITQLTNSRLHMLQSIAEHWKGPISATIYIHETLFQQSKIEVKNWLYNTSRLNIAIHYVLEKGNFYPVNRLRNVAQDNTRAEYVFVIDVDFIPNRELDTQIQTYINSGFFNSEKHKTLIVAAFEMMSDSESFPETKLQLIELRRKRIIRQFHKRLPNAHGPTNYRAWLNSNQPYQITYEIGYEPYVVLKRELSQSYDERFVQRYYNKVSHVYMLNHKKFEFWVMPDGYLVHLPHEYDSKKSSPIYRCAYSLWHKFQREANREPYNGHRFVDTIKDRIIDML